MDFSQRLQQVQRRIGEAARRAGRDPASIALIAVSKLHPAADLRVAYAAGVRDFGENYVQELVEKHAALSELPDVRFHLIGHLQRNKARAVVPIATSLHTLDDARTIAECERRAAAANRAVQVFLQVNVGEETQKSGCSPAELAPLVDAVLQCPHLQLQGLMTIPPATEEPDDARPFFRRLYELQQKLHVPLARLSMGMSSDFEVAIEEGATDVRVGTALFGARS